MKIANSIEVPDVCPKDCKFIIGPFYQGNMCSRCPVFNCAHTKGFCLIEPEDYRLDWAKEWKRFFNGEVDEPYLTICLTK